MKNLKDMTVDEILHYCGLSESCMFIINPRVSK